MRIVSLVPAATEIVALLGELESLVGVSHECDFPPPILEKPRVTHCSLQPGLASGEIDNWVRETLSTTGSLYRIDECLLRELKPDVILTQALCDVCAVGFGSVQALAATLPGSPAVVNLEPRSLSDILENIREVGRVLGVTERAESEIASLGARSESVRAMLPPLALRPKCVLIEWIDPLYCSGHWGPELIELAGGTDPLGNKGDASKRIRWESIREAEPEILVLACCGYSADRTRNDVPILERQPGWLDLPAVRHSRVYIVDGNAYFHRPGPRIIDSLELLAKIIRRDTQDLPVLHLRASD